MPEFLVNALQNYEENRFIIYIVITSLNFIMFYSK